MIFNFQPNFIVFFNSDDRKSSVDNLSICSDLSSIQNIDWECSSNKSEKSVSSKVESDLQQFRDPFDDTNLLKWFHKEVERYEKNIESLNKKTLSGLTNLDCKWKDLQDLLVIFVSFSIRIASIDALCFQVKDESKRTTSVAKLYPEKNRNTDCIPYDHSRVQLPTNTDDYINACYVKVIVVYFHSL